MTVWDVSLQLKTEWSHVIGACTHQYEFSSNTIRLSLQEEKCVREKQRLA